MAKVPSAQGVAAVAERVLLSPRMQVSIPVAVSAFRTETESEQHLCAEILAHVGRDFQVQLRHFKPPEFQYPAGTLNEHL